MLQANIKVVTPMTEKDKKHTVDLQHIEFDKDGIVPLALHGKETQKESWKSMQQFKDIKPTDTQKKK
ncbi:hypothetical protein [Alteromonas hispanica]|uniref:Uncharacterized protein n=1 Tax=Alteromonas hispanica TaxID=315421 RepID=A0A6L9MR60_9ALTE|nr:hypothetical protein [Alteromonas hispanica]NDW20373.1 hypothetical protein [Alteromonas hispanica]